MRNFFRAEGAGAPSRGVRRIGSEGGNAPREAERRWRKMPKGGGFGRRRFFEPVWEYLFFKG